MAVTVAAEYRSLRDVFAKVTKEEGIRALYRGYPATVLGVIPYAGVSFFTYDTLKQLYYEKYGGSRHALTNMLFGGAAGALAQTASYPLDIVRRRMQTARPVRGRYPCGTMAPCGPPRATCCGEYCRYPCGTMRATARHVLR
ncbi:hypothetical protein ACJJTC_019705 [Scirpophaga incertulas]